MATPEQVESLRQIIVKSALWGWDMHRLGASSELTARIANDVHVELAGERAEPEEGAR